MDPSDVSRQVRGLTEHKFFLLFLFLLTNLVLYPYVQNGGVGYFIFRVIGSVGILIAVYAIRLRRTLLLVALLLAVPAIGRTRVASSSQRRIAFHSQYFS